MKRQIKHRIFCFSGWAGTGKDECAKRLITHHKAVQTGLADAGKRHAADVYEFSEQQLWGPSQFRNAGDPRYPKPILRSVTLEPVISKYPNKYSSSKNLHIVDYPKEASWDFSHLAQISENDPRYFLSPRELLQQYLDLLNNLYETTWIERGIRDHRAIAAGTHTYSRTVGLIPSTDPHPVSITCFSDFRYLHEHRAIKTQLKLDFIPILIRIKRPSCPSPPYSHVSETEQTRIPDRLYDFIISNDQSLEHLYEQVDRIVTITSSQDFVSKSWDEALISPDPSNEYFQ